ncbi:MAG: hypothetical protein ABIT08_04505 [Bacteroidia bacterium]
MSDKNVNAIFRIIIFSIIAGSQILHFFFWNGPGEMDGFYELISFQSQEFYMMAIGGLFFPIITVPLLLGINKDRNVEWRMIKEIYIEPPSFNADLFDPSRPVNFYQDTSYGMLSYGIPNFILYLTFKGQFCFAAIGLNIGLGMLIAVQITLRVYRGKY